MSNVIQLTMIQPNHRSRLLPLDHIKTSDLLMTIERSKQFQVNMLEKADNLCRNGDDISTNAGCIVSCGFLSLTSFRYPNNTVVSVNVYWHAAYNIKR